MDVGLIKALQKHRQFAEGLLTPLSNLLSVKSLRTILNPGLFARAPSSICSHVICMNASQSGEPLGKHASLILAFLRLGISDTGCPAKSCAIFSLLF
jgi:hypothetical protein